MAAYLKYGKTIKGESLAEGHKGSEGWIEVMSVQFGAGRAITSPVGGSSKREATSPDISEVTLTKLMDSTSPLLLQEACIGKGEDAELHLVQTGTGSLETYLTLKLTNCMISGYSMSSAGDRPTESISINFTKVEQTYQGYDDKGKADTAKKQTFIYDLAAAKKV